MSDKYLKVIASELVKIRKELEQKQSKKTAKPTMTYDEMKARHSREKIINKQFR